MASCASHPIRFQDSLIINICGMNKVILDFLHGDSDQAKVAPGTTTFCLSVAFNQVEGFFD